MPCMARRSPAPSPTEGRGATRRPRRPISAERSGARPGRRWLALLTGAGRPSSGERNEAGRGPWRSWRGPLTGRPWRAAQVWELPTTCGINHVVERHCPSGAGPRCRCRAAASVKPRIGRARRPGQRDGAALRRRVQARGGRRPAGCVRGGRRLPGVCEAAAACRVCVRRPPPAGCESGGRRPAGCVSLHPAGDQVAPAYLRLYVRCAHVRPMPV